LLALEKDSFDVLELLKCLEEDGEEVEEGAEDQQEAFHLPQSFAQSTLNDVRRAVWIEKDLIKDWVPLDQSLHLHFLRVSLFFLFLSTARESNPRVPSNSQLKECGFRAIDPRMEISRENIMMDFGQGNYQ